MNLDGIVAELRAERDRIDKAIAVLTATGSRSRRDSARASQAIAAPTRRRRSRMSAATRKRLSVQMKKRWAERKKAQGRAR